MKCFFVSKTKKSPLSCFEDVVRFCEKNHFVRLYLLFIGGGGGGRRGGRGVGGCIAISESQSPALEGRIYNNYCDQFDMFAPYELSVS